MLIADMRTRCAFVVAALLAVPATSRAQSNDLSTYVLFGSTKLTVGHAGGLVGGNVGSNGLLSVKGDASLAGSVQLAADRVKIAAGSTVDGDVFFNELSFSGATIHGNTHFGVTLPILTLPPPPTVAPGASDLNVPEGGTVNPVAGAYRTVRVDPGGTLILRQGTYDLDSLLARSSSKGGSSVRCGGPGSCTVRVAKRLSLAATSVGVTGPVPIFQFGGTATVTMGRAGSEVHADVSAPRATIKLKSSNHVPSTFFGRFAGAVVATGSSATIVGELGGVCGDGLTVAPEECDPPDDGACPGRCTATCQCTTAPGTTAKLHAVGPSVLNNATTFGLQLFGENFLPGAQLELSDASSLSIIETLPTTWVSSTELTAQVPPGMVVPLGIQRELVAKVINPGAAKSAPPDIGHCQTDAATSPTACTKDADCPSGTGPCLTGDQRLTMFNDAVFLNPNSAAVVPAPYGLCDDGSRCQAAADCTGIGGGACSPKLYVTPQQRDELWVFNTGTAQFVDQDGGQPGIQGIPVGDNPFHVEMLNAGGPARAWVVNRFEDAVSIIDPATDTELVRLTGAALGVPGRLKMETEIEFNRAGTRAYLSNENLDEVQVLDISGAHHDAPLLVDTIDVGVNPRGMATNAADTRLYVANIQTADISVVDIAPGSPTENQVLRTIAARATDDIVGGRADGWETFVISGRAPRGIVFSDARNALFVTSIGPQTGPRTGVSITGGAIINPTVTVIDAASDTIVAHVALNGLDPDRPTCSDPELMALDDARSRLYVTCQGSGVIDVLDTGLLAAGAPAELAGVPLPLPTDVTVPTLNLPSVAGTFGAKSCAAFTSSSGTPCSSNADCSGCPTRVDALPAVCCAMNNPIGLHNGPRGIAISDDRNTLWVVNQFTTSLATLDVSPSDPTAITVPSVTSYPGAFGSNAGQQDRRLGQIDFFTDVRHTTVSCATCHIDDHQDGVFFEADVRGPRLRRVLSVRSTRDFPPLLQDQLVPDLTAFTDIVVQVERGGPICIPCVEIGGSPFCSGGSSDCAQTSNQENRQNTTYAKAITFFPNPNLNPDGSLSTTVPLPGGLTGDAVHGEQVFDQLACQQCHPEPLFTIDQLRTFDSGTLGQPVRMRDVSTPVFVPLRAKCQDGQRPTGFDNSSGFSVPTLRGIWDTFPLLVSGSAGFTVAGTEPAFSAGCTPGAPGCCAQLQSPVNPGGITVPEEHLDRTTKDAIRAVLTPPLAVPGSGHGGAIGLSPSDLNALIAYLRSL